MGQEARNSIWRAPGIVRELALVFFGRRQIYRVRGESMEPTLTDGDFVCTNAARTARVGDVVVARDREGRTLIKRIGSRGTNTVSLMSDNPANARDSRHAGSIATSNVLGVVTAHFSRPKCLRTEPA